MVNWSPPQKSSVGTILSSLSGYQPILKNGFSERALLRLSQVFWKKPHTPEGLARLLSHHFNVPVSIIPFQGAWHTIPKNQRTFLVRNGRNILGHNFMVGQRAWCQDDGVLVKIKISSIDLFLNLLPGGKHYFSIYSLIRLYLNPRFHFKIVLQLSKTHTFSLGSQKGPFFLGWTSWIGHPRTQETTVVISKPPQRSFVYNERYTSSMT